jgi:hypothetical protein
MKVSYTKEQRMRAKADNLALVTIDLPGFTFQGPVDRERAGKLDAFVMEWISERRPGPNAVRDFVAATPFQSEAVTKASQSLLDQKAEVTHE